jgi:hypothetical protein
MDFNPAKSIAEFFEQHRDHLFQLNDAFITEASKWPEPWAATKDRPENVVAALVFNRTYSRDGERWYQCIQRVVNGTFRVIQRQCYLLGKPFEFERMQSIAQKMYFKIFNMKYSPPGRGLFCMGSPVIEKAGLAAALNNCAFVTTKNMDKDPTEPFTFLFEFSMLGTGVGISLDGAGKAKVYCPETNKPMLHHVEDSREGWTKSLEILLLSYFKEESPSIQFDYSNIRPAGVKLKTFGGVSSGYECLYQLHEDVRKTLNRYIGSTLDSRGIADIINMIGVAVVSGNVRRTSEILFGDPNDETFLNLKNYSENPDRAAYGWTSNNSVFAKVGMDYTKTVENIYANGEPGFLWQENARKYSRLCEPKDWKDLKCDAGNPCLEISLESHELCCLSEVFLNRNESLEEFLDTLYFAFLYAKVVTLLPTHYGKTNEVISRNRRIGTSITGIAQFLSTNGLHELKKWCKQGYKALKKYDKEFSDWFGVPQSIKITTVKPSGTVSLLAGATPGVHFPISNYYIRRVVLAKNSPYVPLLKEAGYYLEDSAYEKKTSCVVEIPVCMGENVRKQSEVSMWEQLSLAAFLQKYWASNQVSCTISFDPEKEPKEMMVHALEYFQYQLKGISFLPQRSNVLCEYTIHDLYETNLMTNSIFTKPLRNLANIVPIDSTTAKVQFEPWVDTERIQSILVQWEQSKQFDIQKKKILPYAQMPYEAITKEEYEERIRNLKPVDWNRQYENDKDASKGKKEEEGEIPESLKFCDGDKCVLMD